MSVRQNAERCGVTESALRKYINSRGIDRRYDEQLKRYNSIKQFLQAHKGANPSEVAKSLGIAVNTAKKYMRMECPPQKPTNDKISKVNLSKLTAPILSVSRDQTAILGGILRLFCSNAPTFDCDLTTSLGYFYRNGIPRPAHLYDKYPQSDDVRPLDEAYSLPDNSFRSIIIDLPFLVQSGTTEKSYKSMMIERFNSFQSIEELYQVNRQMLALSYRLLVKKGVLVMKTQNINKFGKQHWVVNYIVNEAAKLGYKLLDEFILVGKTRLMRAGYDQHCARKLHSYFLCLMKS